MSATPPDPLRNPEDMLSILRSALDDSDSVPCPDALKLERFAKDQIPEPEADALRVHVNVCPTCRELADRLRLLRPASEPALHSSDLTTSVAADGTTPSSPRVKAGKHLPEIEGYRITGVLGQGGMGIVYRAVQTKLNRAVALKVLPAMVGGANPKAVERFRREATAAARLHHTHIVPIYDFGESRDAYFYAMELITGQSLSTIIDRLAKHKAATLTAARLADLFWQVIGNADEGEAGAAATPEPSASTVGMGESSTGRSRIYYQRVARWMADAADALHYAHLEGIVHRDIKPANLMVASDGRIVLADFGLAKLAGDHSLTLTGSFLGTARYMSPEQAMSGRVRVDHRTDVYSLGTTMYELLCFRPVFIGDDEKEILGAVIAREPIPPRRIAPTVPQELQTICLKCLEKHPNSRFDTARDLSEELRRYLRDEPLVTVPPGPIRRALKYVRRHPTGVTAVLATVVVLVATAGIGWAMGRARDHKVNGLTDRANQLGREKRFTEATDLMKEALDLRPNHALAWSSFCWLQREWLDHDRSMRTRERLDDAEKTCRRALELDPENVYTTNYLAHVFRMLGRPQEAVQLYKSILDRSPEYYFVWSSLGATYASMGDLNLAEESLQKGAETAKKMESGSETKWVGMTLRNLASLELHLKKPDAAIHAALALEVYDKDPATLALVARIEMEKSPTNFEPIIERIQNADFMASGADPLILRIRSFVHLQAGQFEHARDYARKALEGKDEPATHARLILAVALAQLKDSAVARDALHIAIQEWPEDLREPSAYRATIEKGVLWFESAEELFQLRDQAERLIAATSPSP